MSDHKRYFFISTELLYSKMREKNLSDSMLSKEIGRSRSWLNAAKKRESKDGTIRIEEQDALAIAGILGCPVQDIGCNNQLIDPMEIDYRTAALDYLEKLLNINPADTVELLRYASNTSPARRKLLLATLMEFSDNHFSISTSSADTWFRYLLFAQLGQLIAPKIDVASESQLRKEYSEILSKKFTPPISYDNMLGAMQNVLSPKIKKIARKFDVAVKDIDILIDECSKFLVGAFNGFPLPALLVELYKQDIWILK